MGNTKEYIIEYRKNNKEQASLQNNKWNKLQNSSLSDLDRLWVQYKSYKSCSIKRIKEAEELLCRQYMYIATIIAKKNVGKYIGHVSYDDLHLFCMEGLLYSLRKFIIEEGTNIDKKFRTYANMKVKYMMIDQIRNRDDVPRTIRLRYKKLCRLMQKENLTEDEAIIKLEKIKSKRPVEWDDIRRKYIPMHNVSFEDLNSRGIEEGNIMEKFEADPNNPSVPYEMLEFIKNLKKYKFSTREISILKLRFCSGFTMEEVGEQIGMSESRISQLLPNILIRIKEHPDLINLLYKK